ncbi:MAG: hypothetical protein KF709_11170 [Gemmatimonadaceae bacterium]|nr:hypothetical protein [Gemmatimonadaceae bacterium]
MRSPRRPVVPLALSLTLLAACTDSLEAPTASPAQLHNGVTSAFQMRDEGIDLSDSHFSAVVETTTEYLDEAPAGLPLPRSESEAVYVEGGYAVDGSVRFGTWFEDQNKNPTIASARLEYGRVNLYDYAGDRQFSELYESFMALLGLPPSTLDDAYFPFAPLPQPGCQPGDPSCLPMAELRDAPGGATVTDVGGIREVRWQADASAATRGGPSEMLQRYRKVPSAFGAEPDWQLIETSSVTRADARGKGARKQVSRIRYRSFHRNPEREDEREKRRKERKERRSAAPTGPGVIEAVRPAPAAAAPAIVSSVLHRPSPDPEGNILSCPRGGGDFDRVRNVQNGIQVVYQHGLCSDASTFSVFDYALSASIPISRSRAFSLESSRSVEDQVTDLRQKLTSKSTVPQVFIGHSQGGLVARRFGQRYPELVNSVITIGTPNRGAYLADVPSEFVSDAMLQAMAPSCYLDIVCNFISTWAYEVLVGEITLGLDRTFPALGNLRTGSPFLAQLNAGYEQFQRASIETTPKARWSLARMIGDDRSPYENLQAGRRPGGDALVTDVEKVYSSLQFANAISQFLLFTVHRSSAPTCQRVDFGDFWPGCSYATSVVQWYTQQYQSYLLYLIYDLTGRIMNLMNRVDATWNYLVARNGEAADGLVHAPSQRYPDAPGRYEPRRFAASPKESDSHSGQTKSPRVLLSTREALASFSKGTTP